ncbi:phage tail-collar fiber domain-containing protein [Pseudomonas sp. PAB10]|uniref:phage tail protein n=1 Tax=Pseudomonas sp. PAB10 TaxID=3233047 RepID=UPI003F9450AA
MVDKNTIFGGMLTTLGAAKKTNCDALRIPWEPRYMLIGDANGTDPVPDPSQTKLVNQVYRAQLNQLYVSPTDNKILVAELVLPPDVGGWWIKELALEDKDGVFSAVSNVAPSYKPLLAQNSGRNQVVRMHIITSGTANIQLKIDPSVVLATRGYVDDSIKSVLPPDKEEGSYRQVIINKRGIVIGGSNPTTLDGYGIADAFRSSGGNVTGNINLVDSRSVNVVATDSASWAGGLHTVSKAAPGNILGGFGAWGNKDKLNCLYMGLSSAPWEYGYGVRVTSVGTSISGPLYAEGAGISGVRFGTLADIPNTLGGYGVSFASESDAVTGADTNKPMNALRVFQAIVAKVVQATGSTLGIARLASQLEVNAGVDDSTIVTPKKLRFGFSMLLGANGYIAFPVWLGSFILQWGLAAQVGQASTTPGAQGPTRDVSLPIAFPNEALRVFPTMNFTTMSTSSAFAPGATIISRSVIRVQNNYSASAGDIAWWAIGY